MKKVHKRFGGTWDSRWNKGTENAAMVKFVIKTTGAPDILLRSGLSHDRFELPRGRRPRLRIPSGRGILNMVWPLMNGEHHYNCHTVVFEYGLVYDPAYTVMPLDEAAFNVLFRYARLDKVCRVPVSKRSSPNLQIPPERE